MSLKPNNPNQPHDVLKILHKQADIRHGAGGADGHRGRALRVHASHRPVSRHHASDGFGLGGLSGRERAHGGAGRRRPDRGAGQRRRKHALYEFVEFRRPIFSHHHLPQRHRPRPGGHRRAEPHVAGHLHPARGRDPAGCQRPQGVDQPGAVLHARERRPGALRRPLSGQLRTAQPGRPALARGGRGRRAGVRRRAVQHARLARP